MLKHVAAAAVACALIALPAAPSIAQAPAAQAPAAQAPATTEKKVTPQQQKMKDCNAQAKTKSLAGAERKKFMSGCLKG